MKAPLDRSTYLQVLYAALAARQYRYARQAALEWLGVYPGDLAVSLAYARALHAENRLDQAATILNGLCRADPEDIEAVEARLAVERKTGGDGAGWLALRFALTGRPAYHPVGHPDIPAWSDAVWKIRLGLANKQPAAGVERQLQQALRTAPDQPLVAVTHLQVLEGYSALAVRLGIAEGYARRWPDCLPILLRLAEWRMQAGQHAEAVALLHQAASRDVGGQVIQRLWGAQHPYRSLWPEHPEQRLPGSPPAAVAAVLGWNRLEAGELTAALAETIGTPQSVATHPGSLPGDSMSPDSMSPDSMSPDSMSPDIWNPLLPHAAVQKGGTPANPAPAVPALPVPVALPVPTLPPADLSDPELEPAAQDVAQAVADALDRTARRHHLPAVSQLDGRHPVYVIFSLHQRLVAAYGAQAAALVESEMAELAETIGRLPRWGARLILADDPACLGALGLTSVRSGDPWVLKLFLADLDAALARTGERLGALLIVGGPEIVPFHHLPNPVDDQDVDVPSDNPYATRDENYFVPQWPVGRLPGAAGRDAHLLLTQLQNIHRSHAQRQKPPSGLARLWGWLRWQVSRGSRLPGQSQPSFGYTAAVWRRAAAQVFSPIGRAHRLHISPPFGLDGAPDGAALDSDMNGLSGRVPGPYGRLGYFNLHGLVDAPEWYGQRDPLDDSDAPDYPVALRPQDIALPDGGQPPSVPRVVFSEACYGLHIQGRTCEQAIALRFLQAGALAVAGSTVMAYGAIGTPLVAADLLGQTFWRLLQDGLPAGEALRQAKINLATEMSQRQGYLDGEDQKTLIAFILYGDPLAQVTNRPLHVKSIRHQSRLLAELRTVCDRSELAEADPSLPPEVLAGVRRVVVRYLPGMSDARVTYTHSRERCSGQGHACPTSQMEHPPSPGGLPRPNIPARRTSSVQGSRLPALVTLSKQVSRAEGVHPRIARLTLNERGKLMKLVVSR